MSTLRCPACRRLFELETDMLGACAGCGARLDVRLFAPVAPRVDEAAPALPSDAVCAHHPGKRAEHICAGTGAYVCALCAVSTGGDVYSAAYLGSEAGRQRARQAFATQLDRPDAGAGAVLLGALLLLVPCVNMLAAVALAVLIPWAFVLIARAAHLRHEGNPVYARLIRPWSLWAKGAGLALVALGMLAAIAAFVIGVSGR